MNISQKLSLEKHIKQSSYKHNLCQEIYLGVQESVHEIIYWPSFFILNPIAFYIYYN
jgi:hypothetical protein